jgi:hypothetical protein
MTIPVIIRPDAEADIVSTYDTLEQARAVLGDQK